MRCKNIIKTLLDILFPQVCGICGKLSGNSLCKKCEILLKKQSKFEIYENDSLENYFDEHMYFFKYLKFNNTTNKMFTISAITKL